MYIKKLQSGIAGAFRGNQRNKWLILLSILFICALFPVRKPVMSNDYSRVILDTKDRILRVFLNKDQQYCFPPDLSDSIPHKLEKAVLSFEDRFFYYHPGINPWSLIRATYLNIVNQRIVSGGSTITMQVARIRKQRSRNIWSKVLEIFESFRFELRYSKKEILKMYLDHAPYGGNIQGYQTASWRYFGTNPDELTWAQATLLAVLPNSPGQISPIMNNNVLKLKRDKLLKSLHSKGEFDEQTYKLALLEEIPEEIVAFPFLSPQFTRKIDREISYGKPVVKTTLNKEIQEKTRFLAQRHMKLLVPLGIPNCAVLVAETRSRKVRAYIGSNDYNDDLNLGKVDGITASRSSGSILKPFLYALSVEKGIVLPETQIMDIPTYYGAFSPHNANESYDGVVRAKNALIRSLNVPAVRLLYTYGQYNFYDFLKQAGVSTLFRESDEYGLSLILGGSEIQLWDVVQLYCGLGDKGNFSELQYLEDQDNLNYRHLIDEASAYLVLECLKEVKRPGAEYYWDKYMSQKPVAWKTGTSYGHKDAWAIGVTPDWVVGVWIGNFTGESNKSLSGARSAGPLLFQVLNALPPLTESNWFETPEYDMETVDLCAATGFVAGEFCEDRVESVRPSVSSGLRICPYHKRIFIDSLNSFEVCSYCWNENRISRTILVYPPGVIQYLRNKGALSEKLPVHNEKCPVLGGKEEVEILYPLQGMKLQVVKDFDGQLQEIVMRAAHRHKETSLYWYLDDSFLGMTMREHVLSVKVTAGEYNLYVIDEKGNKSSVRFSVVERKK